MASIPLLASEAAQSKPELKSKPRIFEVNARGTTGEEQIRLIVADQVLATWTLTKSLRLYQATSGLNGPVRIEYFNDEFQRDVRIDHLKVDSAIYQAEDQRINTGAFQNGECGGGQGRTEWMRCNGYIEFQLPSHPSEAP